MMGPGTSIFRLRAGQAHASRNDVSNSSKARRWRFPRPLGYRPGHRRYYEHNQHGTTPAQWPGSHGKRLPQAYTSLDTYHASRHFDGAKGAQRLKRMETLTRSLHSLSYALFNDLLSTHPMGLTSSPTVRQTNRRAAARNRGFLRRSGRGLRCGRNGPYRATRTDRRLPQRRPPPPRASCPQADRRRWR